eukprot:gene7639-9100_t
MCQPGMLQAWYVILVWSCMQAGPTFVKLGQWASTRPDVFPRGLCEVFAELHSSVAPQPFTDTRHTIQEYFGGRRLEEVFAAVDEEPLGAGCIAQDGDGYGVEFPHVHPRLPASDSILVETEQDGQFVMDWMRGGNSTPEEHRAVALAGARSFFKMVLVDNLVHADLHPGNILIRYMPKEAQDARGGVRLVYLDAGLCTELGADDRRNFIDLFTAVALKDGELAGRLMLERSRHHQCSDPEAFAVAQTVAQVNCSQFTLAKVKIGSILNQILDLARVHHVLLESQFTGLIIGIMLLEGIGRQLYPDLDLFQVALPMLLNSRAEYQGAAAKIVFQAGFGNDKNSAT